ncbi:TPA: MFS transporter [Enterococcus faecium]|uniref:MFS transporter n=1 Tax=Enterococcus TaxID=1350 RepID=UPI00190E91D6|nr:MFS transporter [Enterococcus faecium]
MIKNEYRNLLKHIYWGSFDSGVIFIFLSLMIWDDTENMVTVALAFSIPIVIDTVIDYFFSSFSDHHNRKKLFIIGNIGSAIALSFYGFAQSIYILYGLIFIKSLFAKLYQSSLDPYIRENIKEDLYMDFLSQRNIQMSVGASIGGFALMMLYGFLQNIALIFVVSGLIELYSTVYLFKLKDNKLQRRKEKEDAIDLEWIKYITFIYTVEGFGIALIVNRMLIYIHEFQGISLGNVGFVFFVVYGVSSVMAARIYKRFNKISLKVMLITSFLLQAFLLIIFIQINQLFFIIIVWFIFELVANIADIYASDKINSSLFTEIGKRLSKFRIMIAIGNVLGQFIVSRIWDQFGMSMSFYFSSIILILLSFVILLKNEKHFEKN